MKDAGQGGKGNLPLESVLVIKETEPWDGKDGEMNKSIGKDGPKARQGSKEYG